MSLNGWNGWAGAVAGCALTFAVGLEPPVARAQSCTADADCTEGFHCDRSPGACTDREGEEPDCTTPQGECERAPIPCAEDADCPLALTCETSRRVEECAVTPAGNDGEPADAGTGCTVSEEEIAEPSCVYEPIECADDSECDQGFSCQPLGRVEHCSDVGAMPAICMPGESCDSNEPSEPSEPVCTEVETLYYCFPVRQDCSADSDCSAGWVCEALPEDAQDAPPPGWEGAGEVCLPEGLALALAGEVEIASTSKGSSDEAGRQALGEADSSGAGSPRDNSPGEGADAGGAGSDCSAAPGQRTSSSVMSSLALLALAALRVRRRPASHRRPMPAR